MTKSEPLPWRTIVVWIFCLAAIGVGARNFEEGLTSDAPVYATIGRNIARSGELFVLDTSTPDFVPFAEHPHLGFWVLAAVFKVFPAADWSARIPGHLFYVLFLLLFFGYVRHRSGQRTATFAVLLLWTWSRFSNFFSNVYLDPGCLFFGTAAIALLDFALERERPLLAVLSGTSLALTAMYKGLTVLGFGPALAVLVAVNLRRPKTAKMVAGTLAAFLGVLLVYWLAVRSSRVPQFFETYWGRQMTGRFGQTSALSNLLNGEFWYFLFKDSYGLVLVAFIAFRRVGRGVGVLLPATLLVTFVLMYGITHKGGNQYWVTVLPWIAWLAADELLVRLPWRESRVVAVTGAVAIWAVVIVQYVPVTTHGTPPGKMIQTVREWKNDPQAAQLILVTPDPALNFLGTSRYAWYTDRFVGYLPADAVIPADHASGRSLYLQAQSRGSPPLAQKGWCAKGSYGEGELWGRCH